MITVKQKGDFEKTTKFLKKSSNIDMKNILDYYGKKGVMALASATPVDTGLTSQSWSYKIQILKGKYTIQWVNYNIVNGVPIAIILQYGHGTRNGGYVKGQDYINPAIKPIMDEIAESVWKEVINA